MYYVMPFVASINIYIYIYIYIERERERERERLNGFISFAILMIAYTGKSTTVSTIKSDPVGEAFHSWDSLSSSCVSAV
jgi:hypothetical protein